MIIKLDNKGRILLPKVIRETLNIKPNERIEVRIEGKKLIIKKDE